MFTLSMNKLICATCMVGFLAAPVTFAKPQELERHYHPSHHKPVVIKPIIVAPSKPIRPKHYTYHRNDLPKRAVMAVIAGVKYAIIDNFYYQKQGKKFVYDPRPPRGHRK